MTHRLPLQHLLQFTSLCAAGALSLSAIAQEPSEAPPPAPALEVPLADPIADRPSRDREGATLDWFLHGFRLGYGYISKFEADDEPESTAINYREELGLRSPHQFLLGYELTQRVVGHSWLNVILVENLTLAGLEQSRFLPSGNFLIGFEFDESFQAAIGVNVAPTRDKPTHIVLAAGWTPRVGEIYLPVHAFFMPDVDGQHRTGVTVGVNW